MLSWVATVVLSFFGGLAQSASPPATRATYPVTFVGPSKIRFPETPQRRGFTVEVSRDDSAKGDFPDDFLVLKVFTNENPSLPIALMRFVSTYGKFELSLVDLTGDGREEFILTTGTCHGTNCREETLTVWRMQQKRFEKIFSVPTFGYCGRRRWWYEREFPDVNGDGTPDLRLVLKYDAEDDPICDPAGIPNVTLQEYVFNQPAAKMVLYRSTERK